MYLTKHKDTLLFKEMLEETELERLVEMFTAEHHYKGRFDQTCYILYLKQNFYPLAIDCVYVAYYKDKGICIRYGCYALRIESKSLQYKLLKLFNIFNYHFKDPIINSPKHEDRNYHEYNTYLVNSARCRKEAYVRTNRPEEENAK